MIIVAGASIATKQVEERSHEAMATFRLDATGRPRQRTQQESRDGVVNITTKLLARRQLSSQWRHCRNSCASKQTGRPSLTGRLEQIGQIHALDLLRRERWDRQKKAKTSSKNKRSRRDTWNARHATQHSQHEQRKRVGRQHQGHCPQQNKASARDDNNKYHLGGFHTKKTNVGCDVLSVPLSH